jgi:hypothetical protein
MRRPGRISVGVYGRPVVFFGKIGIYETDTAKQLVHVSEWSEMMAVFRYYERDIVSFILGNLQ